MAFGSFEGKGSGSHTVSEINMVPLIDVMLVLLVIFIITAPLFTHAIKLDLPSAQSAPAQTEPTTISVSINGAGTIFWNNDPLTLDELEARLTVAAKQQPQPQVQLRADKGTRYEVIAQVMAAAQGNGITKLGFVTETPQSHKK